MYVALVSAGVVFSSHAAEINSFTEAFQEIPRPAEFHVEITERDGPVFANSNGKTLYKWPLHKLRNGYSGEPPGTPMCYDEVVTVTAGFMSPYPVSYTHLTLPTKRIV